MNDELGVEVVCVRRDVRCMHVGARLERRPDKSSRHFLRMTAAGVAMIDS